MGGAHRGGREHCRLILMRLPSVRMRKTNSRAQLFLEEDPTHESLGPALAMWSIRYTARLDEPSECDEFVAGRRRASRSKPKNGPANLRSVEPCRLHQKAPMTIEPSAWEAGR